MKNEEKVENKLEKKIWRPALVSDRRRLQWDGEKFREGHAFDLPEPMTWYEAEKILDLHGDSEFYYPEISLD